MFARLHSIGQNIAQALTINAKWMPTTLKPHELNFNLLQRLFTVVSMTQ